MKKAVAVVGLALMAVGITLTVLEGTKQTFVRNCGTIWNCSSFYPQIPHSVENVTLWFEVIGHTVRTVSTAYYVGAFIAIFGSILFAALYPMSKPLQATS